MLTNVCPKFPLQIWQWQNMNLLLKDYTRKPGLFRTRVFSWTIGFLLNSMTENCSLFYQAFFHCSFISFTAAGKVIFGSPTEPHSKLT